PMTRIGIAGVTGQVGRLLAEEVGKAKAVLTGGTLGRNPDRIPPENVHVFGSVGEMAAASDAVIDLTHAQTIIPFSRQLRIQGAAWIVGASGLATEHWDALRE